MKNAFSVFSLTQKCPQLKPLLSGVNKLTKSTKLNKSTILLKEVLETLLEEGKKGTNKKDNAQALYPVRG